MNLLFTWQEMNPVYRDNIVRAMQQPGMAEWLLHSYQKLRDEYLAWEFPEQLTPESALVFCFELKQKRFEMQTIQSLLSIIQSGLNGGVENA